MYFSRIVDPNLFFNQMIKIHHLIQGTAPARNMLGSTGAATPLQKLQVLTGEALKMGLDGLNHIRNQRNIWYGPFHQQKCAFNGIYS